MGREKYGDDLTPRPQDTECTTIVVDTGDEALNQGVANGLLTYINSLRNLEYDEEDNVYRVK